MTKIARFKTLNNGEDFIKILKNKELLIYEDIQGSKVFAQYDGNQFIIKPKNFFFSPHYICCFKLYSLYLTIAN